MTRITTNCLLVIFFLSLFQNVVSAQVTSTPPTRPALSAVQPKTTGTTDPPVILNYVTLARGDEPPSSGISPGDVFLSGNFGKSVVGVVTIGGATASIKSWSQTQIACHASPTAAGDVVVTVGKQQSNALQITKWDGHITETFPGLGTSLTWTYDLHFRASLNTYFYDPSLGKYKYFFPLDEHIIGASITGSTSAFSVNDVVYYDGSYLPGYLSYTLKGSGMIPVTDATKSQEPNSFTCIIVAFAGLDENSSFTPAKSCVIELYAYSAPNALQRTEYEYQFNPLRRTSTTTYEGTETALGIVPAIDDSYNIVGGSYSDYYKAATWGTFTAQFPPHDDSKPPTVTLPGKVTVCKNQTKDIQVTVNPSPISGKHTVTLELTNSGGAATFKDGTTTKTITQSTTVTIQGVTESEAMGDITLKAKVDGKVVASAPITVVWVKVSARFSGNVMDDDAGEPAYMAITGTDELGSIIGDFYTFNPFSVVQLFAGSGIEYVGTVSPSDFSEAITLKRTVNAKFYISTRLITSRNGDDTSNSSYRDDDPQSGGSGGKGV